MILSSPGQLGQEGSRQLLPAELLLEVYLHAADLAGRVVGQPGIATSRLN